MPQNINEQIQTIKNQVQNMAPKTGGNYKLDDIFTISRFNAPKISHCSELPVAVLILQGHKLLNFGSQEFNLTPGMLLVSCVETPTTSSIIGASEQNPFLAIYFYLNRHIIADLLLHLPNSPGCGTSQTPYGTWVEKADSTILDAFSRLANLASLPRRINILGPLVLKELHYLILESPQGYRLRDVYMRGGRDSRIINVINWLKAHLEQSPSMDFLAGMAHMSLSSFHRHFKDLTGHSPLQYIKKMRLFEAQRLMLADHSGAAEAAIRVGYESATQFNREYRRLFGEPPARDISRLRKKIGN